MATGYIQSLCTLAAAIDWLLYAQDISGCKCALILITSHLQLPEKAASW